MRNFFGVLLMCYERGPEYHDNLKMDMVSSSSLQTDDMRLGLETWQSHGIQIQIIKD